jgi:hypothetical protein
MKSKQTLKVGQKYRVIKDHLNNKYDGTIVTVLKIMDKHKYNYLFEAENGHYFNCLDKLQLITPKKEVKKEEINWDIDVRYEKDVVQVYTPSGKESFITWIEDIRELPTALDGCEVIGNIYQNKSLLNSTQGDK